MRRSGKSVTLFRVWAQSFASMRSLSTFYPFVIYAIFQIGLLMALVYFAYPPFSRLLVPLMSSIFGEAALHYPNNYLVLAPLFEWGNILLSGFVGAVVIGAATYLFAMRVNGHTPSFSKGIREAGHRYLLLVAVWVVETAFILGAMIGIPSLARQWLEPSYTTGRLIDYGSVGVAILVGAVFAYTTALIVLSRKGLFASLKESAAIFAKAPIASLILIALPTLIRFPAGYLARKAPLLISQFRPEIMIAVVFIGIVVSFFANYFLVGTVTYFFIGRVGKRESVPISR
jgi:MFS family permease